MVAHSSCLSIPRKQREIDLNLEVAEFLSHEWVVKLTKLIVSQIKIIPRFYSIKIKRERGERGT